MIKQELVKETRCRIVSSSDQIGSGHNGARCIEHAAD